MNRIYLPSEGPAGWQRLLGDPVKHWRAGYSAMTLANCWEAASGLPPEIARILAQLGPDPELLVALPEHKVPLPGSSRGDSQSDLFALARAGDRTIAITIEGKVEESFDKPLGEWLANASTGKKERLTHICELLGLRQPLPTDVYYQLLHRTAAAVIEAKRFKTDAACMMVHSFSRTGKWFDAFARFVKLFGVVAERERLLAIQPNASPPLYVAWAAGDPKFLES
jgi:hypothetical protein